MSFIGIISEHKSFETIKAKLEEIGMNGKNTLIPITLQSISNMQNIKFETIIIDSDLEKFEQQERILQKICSNANYVILNTDINLKLDILKNKKVTIITYGLNQKATVTISSISETDIQIYVQRNIKNRKNDIIEVEEKHISLKEKDRLKTYEILIIYIISIVYGNKITEQI